MELTAWWKSYCSCIHHKHTTTGLFVSQHGTPSKHFIKNCKHFQQKIPLLLCLFRCCMDRRKYFLSHNSQGELETTPMPCCYETLDLCSFNSPRIHSGTTLLVLLFETVKVSFAPLDIILSTTLTTVWTNKKCKIRARTKTLSLH